MDETRREPILEALGLSSNATEEDVLLAIKQKRYSFTPLADSTDTPRTRPAGDIETADALTGVAVAWGEFPFENCNSSEIIFLPAAGGMFDGKHLNAAAGFNNSDGDLELRLRESHTWPVDESGKEIDPTPSDFGAANRPEAAKPTRDRLHDAGRNLALLGGGLVSITVLWRRRMQVRSFIVEVADQRFNFIEADGPRAAGYREALDILDSIRYKPDGMGWTAGGNSSRSLVDRLATEAVSQREPYPRIVEALAERGIEPSNEARRALRNLAESRLAGAGELGRKAFGQPNRQPAVVRSATKRSHKKSES